MYVVSVKEAVKIISTYSADTFGVCSALFELGGMVVIHDPSGCNSTYTTHDEPRWYDTDSLIFISGLTEMDAIMGNDDKLIDDVVTAAKDSNPAFIVLLCTPVPLMMGTDFPALARVIEDETGIPTFAATTNSMQTYDVGVSWAMEMLARHMVLEKGASAQGFCCSWKPDFAQVQTKRKFQVPPEPIGVNVLGMTPLDFATNGSDQAMTQFLMDHGFRRVSNWAMGSTLGQIQGAAQADVNLVVSVSGLAAAKVLQERFGQPYVVGVPIGDAMTETMAQVLQRAAETKTSAYPCQAYREDAVPRIAIIGEQVTSASLARALEIAGNTSVQVICPLQTIPEITGPTDCHLEGEETLLTALADFDTIIADPLYKPICPSSARFIPLSHEAFSGRLYEKEIPNLIRDFKPFAAKVFGEV